MASLEGAVSYAQIMQEQIQFFYANQFQGRSRQQTVNAILKVNQ